MAMSTLSAEIGRLRGLILQATGPAPDLKQLHLESFKRGPSPVVLKVSRSSPALHEGTRAGAASRGDALVLSAQPLVTQRRRRRMGSASKVLPV